MPTIPYLPPGQSELPAERFLVFATTGNAVVRIDETATAKIAAAYTAEWQSPTLNVVEEGKEMTLASLDLYYAAGAATSVDISASSDGGETFSTPQTIALLAVIDQIRRVRVDFNDPSVTGFDLRFRIQMILTDIVNIYGYRPHLIDRGDLIF